MALSAAFEPTAAPWLIPLAIAGLVFATRGLTVGRAWLPGLVFGIAFQFSLLIWMRSVGTDAYIVLSLLECSFFAPLGILLALVGRLPGWPFWTAVAWVAVEEWRSAWPLGGMPWGRLAFASADTPLAGWLPYVGTTGVTLIWALLGTSLAWLVINVRTRPGRSLGVVVVAAGVVMLPTLVPYSLPDRGEVTVAAVQGNVPGDGIDVLFDHRQVTANHVALTVELSERVSVGEVDKPHFVVWPENSTAVDPFTDEDVNEAINTASAAIDTPILVGGVAQGPEPDQVLNQGIVWHPGTGGGDRYAKQHPVPYGEYIPWRDELPFTATFGQLREIGRDMMAGTRSEPLDINGVHVADAICFDVVYERGIYDQVRAGAEIIVVQTSNAIYSKTHQLEQQFAVSRLRAIETGKPVIVAAINGVSGIIAPDGTVLQTAPVRTQGTLIDTVSLNPGTPPGLIVGPIVGWLCLLLTAVGVVLVGVKGRRHVGEPRVSSSP